jgi:pseudouridine-5'-phosphate glycosidase
MKELPTHLHCSDEVRAALRDGRPVLALESTIITHGMPWPRNLETALMSEREAREAGAVPATIAILDGKARVGLEESDLERLAQANTKAAKCSRRDIACLLASGATAGTTVAATMVFAHQAGIGVFATGGIGGVHRGAESTFDVSADLQELARTPVAVVCAGPKSILDIGLTLEFLETQGVPVIGYQTAELPAFYTRSSGFALDYRLDTPAGIARVIQTQHALALANGLVIANPIPESAAMDAADLERVIEQAVRQADHAGVGGKDLTPFLLQRVEDLTAGGSLEANMALMANNARLGGKIAAALCV